MWTNEQEWRDQVIAQLIYLRTAIYFVGFVVTIGLAAPHAQSLGLSENYVFVIIAATAITAVEEYWRAHRKTSSIEKKILSVDYNNYDA
jgi:hypothetical protein